MRRAGPVAGASISKPMTFFNLLLDLVALILGLSVLGVGSSSPAHRAGTLLGNLKLAESRRTNTVKPLFFLLGLLMLRPLFYAPLTEVLGTVPEWSPTPASVPFRADFFSRLLMFSFISFLWTTIQFVAWMQVLCSLARGCREPGAWNRFFQETLGPLARLPLPIAILLPTWAAGSLWFLAHWPLKWAGILPAVPTELLAKQSAVVAVGLWISIRWLLSALLILRLINTYVYLGNHPFWDFIHQVGGVLLQPFRWIPLRFGKLDLAPLGLTALILAAAWGADRALLELYLRLSP